MKYSISLFRMTNLAHAFITVSSIQNIFVMQIFTSGTLSRIHAPHRIGWPVLTYRSPMHLMRTFVLCTDLLLSLYIASFKRLYLRSPNDLFCSMSVTSFQTCRAEVSRTRDLMLKRDSTSSLNICCDVIRDIL